MTTRKDVELLEMLEKNFRFQAKFGDEPLEAWQVADVIKETLNELEQMEKSDEE